MSPATPPRPQAPQAKPAQAAARPSARPHKLQTPGTGRSWLVTNAVGLGIAFSIACHALLLVMHFVSSPGGLRKERDPGLNIVLVNARHPHAPKKAQALAQANLEGGGDSEKSDDMPTSPLPPQDSIRNGDALVDAQQKVKQLESVQRDLITQSKNPNVSVKREQPKQQTEQPNDTPQPKQGLDMATATAIARQEAVVDRGLRDYAARPRRGVISPSTREYRLAQYGEDWRIKVQRVGELNFPRGAKGSLYGSVQVSVELRPDGSVLSAEISRPSPDQHLNEAVLRIIKLGSPYAPFPPDVRKSYDILVLVRTINFTRDDIGVTSQ
jgi:periplasmic protein TonB